MHEVFGCKVKKYFTFKCICGEHFEVDAGELKDEYETLVCPWCECNLTIHVPSLYRDGQDSRTVRLD